MIEANARGCCCCSLVLQWSMAFAVAAGLGGAAHVFLHASDHEHWPCGQTGLIASARDPKRSALPVPWLSRVRSQVPQQRAMTQPSQVSGPMLGLAVPEPFPSSSSPDRKGHGSCLAGITAAESARSRKRVPASCAFIRSSFCGWKCR